MQNRYVGDVGDFLKLGILRALSPGYRLGVAWWLHANEDHNQDGKYIGYLNSPEKWRHFDPPLFDTLAGIVAADQRQVRALEQAGLLPGATFASEIMPSSGPVVGRRQARQEWLERVTKKLTECDLVFVDPDNGLEPDAHSIGSAKAGKSVLLSELHELSRPQRCLIVYHHHTRRAGGHYAEVEYWADRLRASGFANVDAVRAKPYSPRVYFLLDAPPDIRQHAERLEDHWQGWITWHPNPKVAAQKSLSVKVKPREALGSSTPTELGALAPPSSPNRSRVGRGYSTQPGYINRNDQEVIRSTGSHGTDHAQYVYIVRCRTCGHEYGVNGSDIWFHRCPNHDRAAPGLAF